MKQVYKGRISTVKGLESWRWPFVRTNDQGLTTNGSDKGLTVKTSAFQIFHCGNLAFIDSSDKTKFSPLVTKLTHFLVNKRTMLLSLLKVPLWSNSRYQFFYIFQHKRCFLVILANFSLSRTLELMFFGPLFPTVYGRY